MKKILSLAIATVFAFAASAQSSSAGNPQSENHKSEKASAVKMSTPDKKEEAKKNDVQVSTTKVHQAHPVKTEIGTKSHKDQVKRKQAAKSSRLTMQPSADSKTEKATPKVK